MKSFCSTVMCVLTFSVIYWALFANVASASSYLESYKAAPAAMDSQTLTTSGEKSEREEPQDVAGSFPPSASSNNRSEEVFTSELKKVGSRGMFVWVNVEEWMWYWCMGRGRYLFKMGEKPWKQACITLDADNLRRNTSFVLFCYMINTRHMWEQGSTCTRHVGCTWGAHGRHMGQVPYCPHNSSSYGHTAST